MNADRVTDEMVKAARKASNEKMRLPFPDENAAMRAALSAADAVRDGSASVIYPYYTIDGTGEGDGSASGAVAMLEAYKDVPCTWGRSHDKDEIAAAIAALRQQGDGA